jgi:hypothetical protein
VRGLNSAVTSSMKVSIQRVLGGRAAATRSTLVVLRDQSTTRQRTFQRTRCQDLPRFAGRAHRLRHLSTQTRFIDDYAGLMPASRAFPVIYAATDVGRSADFWHRLRFERVVERPYESELG